MAVKLPDELQAVTATPTEGAVRGITAPPTQGAVAPMPKSGVGGSQVTGSTNGANSSSYSYTSYSSSTPAELPEVPPSQLQQNLQNAQVDAPEVPEAPDLRPELDRWLAAAQQQANNQIDYATQQGITELQRAQEDAQPEFQKQRNQIAIDEQRALDNQALYAEARGDRGGIGQAQYNSIQNTAAQNRLQVQQQQTKLATDTARQIADLRARGEFEKADKALELTQSYLSQLMQLEQWAASYNMDAAQFKFAIAKWKQDYQMQMAQLLEDQRQWEANYGLQRANFLQSLYEWSEEYGYQQARDAAADDKWQQEFDYGKQQDQQKMMADAGEALLSAGIMPSDSQLAAMGMTKEQARQYINALLLAQTASGSSSSSGGGGSSGSGGSGGSRSSGGGGGSGSGGESGGTPQQQSSISPTEIKASTVKYSSKTGIITWKGVPYSTAAFLDVLKKSNLTNAEKAAILAELRKQGLDVKTSSVLAGGSSNSTPKSGTTGSGGGNGSGGGKPAVRQRL